MLAILRQVLLACVVAAVAAVIWARHVPASHAWLDRLGVLGPLRSAGLVPEEAAPAPAAAAGGQRGGATVVAEAPGFSQAGDRVAAIGTAQAQRSVAVSPEVSGRIVRLAVSPGARIEPGTVLVELEREAEDIALAQADLMLVDARDRYDRVARLQSTGSATEIQIREAELVLRQAELRLRQADYDLDRRVIRAPIGGWVGLLDVEVGQPVTPGTEIARIDDRARLLVDFRVPERFVGRIAAGDRVQARALARSDASAEGIISALDNRVDPASRTLRLQAAIDNADDQFRAGMAFEIGFEVAGERLPSVPPLALQWGTSGAFVWIVRDGRAQRLAVQIIQRNADAVLVRADFLPGDLVVREGVQSLRPGAEVTSVLSAAQAALPGPRT
ncbi:MAG: efflux RND transporter periplasmic adaptor subunit [Paracoccaceae bacterium]|nr:MAG: efflux RND transporter periplasmic adaptor subunit [Paracoccaceae bacterium]